MAIRQIANWYENTSEATKYVLRSAGLYSVISIGGNAAAILTETPSLDTLVDMAAPIIAGMYLSNGLDRSNLSEGARNAAHILLPGLIGLDMTNELLRYSGTDNLLSATRDGLAYASNTLNYLTDKTFNLIVHPGLQAFTIGSLYGLIRRFNHFRQEVRHNRPHHYRNRTHY